VERICTDVAFLKDGILHVQGSVADVKARFRTEAYVLEPEREEDFPVLCGAFPRLVRQENRLLLQEQTGALYAILQFVAENRIPMRRIERDEPSLETLFLEEVAK
jgi:ABC-2 type transport system ATP-binding protein